MCVVRRKSKSSNRPKRTRAFIVLGCALGRRCPTVCTMQPGHLKLLVHAPLDSDRTAVEVSEAARSLRSSWSHSPWRRASHLNSVRAGRFEGPRQRLNRGDQQGGRRNHPPGKSRWWRRKDMTKYIELFVKKLGSSAFPWQVRRWTKTGPTGPDGGKRARRAVMIHGLSHSYGGRWRQVSQRHTRSAQQDKSVLSGVWRSTSCLSDTFPTLKSHPGSQSAVLTLNLLASAL